MIPIEFAEPFSPAYCKQLRARSMAIARGARLPRDHFYHRANNEIVLASVKQARHWNSLVVAGGNEAYRYRLSIS